MTVSGPFLCSLKKHSIDKENTTPTPGEQSLENEGGVCVCFTRQKSILLRVRFAVLPVSHFGGYEFELLLGVGMRCIVQATRTCRCDRASALETGLRLSSLQGPVERPPV